jgi:hypothetical protein
MVSTAVLPLCQEQKTETGAHVRRTDHNFGQVHSRLATVRPLVSGAKCGTNLNVGLSSRVLFIESNRLIIIHEYERALCRGSERRC